MDRIYAPGVASIPRASQGGLAYLVGVMDSVDAGQGRESDHGTQTHSDTQYPPRSRGGDVVFDMGHEDVSVTGEDLHATPHPIWMMLERVRGPIARFGRMTGMHFPGISYTAVQSENSEASRSRRPMGGGIQQDGVFSNMNAKPERPRRRVDPNDPNDRGDDDDLADDTLPPTYEIAAADTAPTYWESTAFSGNPLAESEGGWTPESAQVGEPSNLILDGMLLGTLFGFIWNVFVSGSFQFVGFIMTFLLHTTHAAKLGSRTGLGITLIQYAGSLLSRLHEAQRDLNKDSDPSSSTPTRKHLPTTEDFHRSRMICFAMLGLGCVLFLQGMIKYIVLYRYASKLAASGQRVGVEGAIVGETDASEERPVGFWRSVPSLDPVRSMNQVLNQFRGSLFSDMALSHIGPFVHSAEDFVIRPGPEAQPPIWVSDGVQPLAQYPLTYAPSMQRGQGLSHPFADSMFESYEADFDVQDEESHET
ncbi:hypothetical protein MPSI1_002745 [Malassezia psittaci]|uniref:Uncharacterized protein n=1 Tax=Malassezia psittaci TaxID=1821823 RepID=A0AAF0F830_9BASI|nr:hypothetical protein MPSI1_002745 [Malassezia psittaci]